MLNLLIILIFIFKAKKKISENNIGFIYEYNRSQMVY